MTPAPRSVGTALRRHRALMAAIVACCLAVAGAALVIQRPVYRATALLYVDQRYNAAQGFDVALQASELLSAHYVDEVDTPVVLERACKDLGGVEGSCDPASLGNRVSASTVKGTTMIAVSADAGSPQQAAREADAVASAVGEQSRAETDSLFAPTSDYLDSQLTQLATAIAAAQQQAVRSPSDPAAQAALAALQSRQAALVAQQDQVALDRLRLESALTVYQTARIPSKPIQPDPRLYLGAGLAAGAVIAMLAALLLERFDDRIRDGAELAAAARTPLVVTVPDGRGHKAEAKRRRAYAVARERLLSAQPGLRSALIVPASSEELASAAVQGLAHAASEAGDSVLVRAADDETRGAGDLVLIVGGSARNDREGLLAAPHADAGVIVAEVRRTRARDVAAAAESLRAAGVDTAVALLLGRAAGVAAEQPAGDRAEPRDETSLAAWRDPAAS